MRALLDANVLIALLDPDHAQHATAREWLIENASAGWASCPLTQNACLRIMSQPAYPNPLTVSEIAETLRHACESPFHEFWAGDVSLLDVERVDSTRIHGPRQVSDVYLLALAVEHGGRFVTFDERISAAAVTGAEASQLVVI